MIFYEKCIIYTHKRVKIPTMNFLFVSDLHFQTWINAKKVLNKAILDTIKYGYFSISEEWNPYEVTLIVGWDIWNIIHYEDEFDMVLKDLEEFVIYLRNIIINEWFIVKKIYIGEWNHELYNSWTPEWYSRVKDTRALNEMNNSDIFEKVFKNVKVITNFWLSNKVYGKDVTIINSLLYSPIFWIHQYKWISWFIEQSVNKNFVISGELQSWISDFKYLDNDTYDFDLSFISVLPTELQEYVLHKYNLYKNASLYSWYSSVKTPNLYLAQVLFFSEISKIIFNIKKTKSTNLILNFHFPFNYFDGIKYDLLWDVKSVDKNKIFKKNWDNSELDWFFNVDFSWFEFLMEYVPKNVKNIYILNWHTHEKYKIETIYKWRKINIINNCLWYGSDY